MPLIQPIIVIIGAGRVATHLGNRLKIKGLQVSQVINRSEAAARELGIELECAWTTDFSAILPTAEWVLMAVRDDAIAEVATQVGPLLPNALFTHTSGATPGTILSNHCIRYGVLYPLQSFSVNRQPDWSNIPLCIDAATNEDVQLLQQIATQIGNIVYQVNDDQRATLHVAAVFANNFANHCFAIAENMLHNAGLSFDLLHPLMQETLAKALSDSPLVMQTGPALRGDEKTLQRHLDMLSNNYPDLVELYRLTSASIQQYAADRIKNQTGEQADTDN